MPLTSDPNPNDFLTEDPLVLPWSKIVKLLRGQMPYPVAVVLATVLKLTKMLGGGGALNAGARDSEPIAYEEIPILGKKAFDGIQVQLPEFEFLAYAKREIVGMRQDYSALALSRDQKIVAICQWQQHLTVLPADKMSDEREKSLESSTVEFVSFDRDRPIVTSCVPREHMGASDLFDDSLGDIVVLSNEKRLEEILAEHRKRIQTRSVDYLNSETAISRAKKYGHSIRDYFIGIGLVRPITEKELRKILAVEKQHAERFAKYKTVNPWS